MVGWLRAVNRLCAEAGHAKISHWPRYNHAMHPRITLDTITLEKIAVEPPTLSQILVKVKIKTAALIVVLIILTLAPACTFYGDHPARAMSEATGGEGMERVFWKDVQTGNWVEIERALASNYAGIMPTGTLDRSAALEQYRSWQLKDYGLGDLKTELNGTTIVVTYTITLNGVTSNGTAGSQPLPSTPQHMMTVWQQQKAGWVVIAHSVSPQ
jgi:hypothetical protein